MTHCVITAHAGVDDGTPCVERGAHAGDCPGDTCTGCRPTPAAPSRITCTRHDDNVRTALQSFAELYAALGETTTRNSRPGTEDNSSGHLPGCTRGLNPDTDDICFGCAPAVGGNIDARHLIRSTLVAWCHVLEDDLGIPAPDERQIELDTRGTITRRQWDVDIAVAGMRGINGDHPTPERRAELAAAAETHRRVIRQLQDDRATGVDVIRALASHVDDHRPKLLGEYVPATCPQCRKADRTTPSAFGGLLAGHICLRCGIHIGPVIDLAKGGRVPLNAEQHRDRGRIFAEDILDVAHRARSLAYPNRAPITIACSCGGGRVTIDTDPDRYYTCPACGDHGVLAYWQRREAPPMTSDPMPLAHLTDWLLRHHRIPVTLEQLRHWTKGDRPALRPTTPAGRDPAGRRTPALYNPTAALAVARQRTQKGRRSA